MNYKALLGLTTLVAVAAMPFAANAQEAVSGGVSAKPEPVVAPAPGAVATVNGKPIAQAELERLVQLEISRGAKDDAALRSRLRERLVNEEVFYQEALRLQLDQMPQYKLELLAAQREILATMLLRTVRPAPVTDAEVQAVYKKTAAHLAPNDVMLQAIVVASEAEAGNVWSQLARGSDFASQARASSILPSGKTGGFLGWMNLRTEAADKALLPLPQVITAACRRLVKGGMLQPLADGSGRWWIVRIVDTRTSNPLDFNKAAGAIRASLETTARQRAQSEYLADLRKKAVVK